MPTSFIKSAYKNAQKERKRYRDRASYNINQGGKEFAKCVAEYGRLERGDSEFEEDKPDLEPWRLELCELAAELRVGDFYLSGVCQIGKSVFFYWLMCYLLANLKLDIAYVFDSEPNKDAASDEKLFPISRKWFERTNTQLSKEGSRNKTLYQLEGANLHLKYAKTQSKGAARAGSGLVAFTADCAIADEASQYPLGIIDVIRKRLTRSRIPTQPLRILGTPGNGTGVESFIRKADYEFYPHTVCNGCGKTIALHPKGCLLKPISTDEAGNNIYLTLSGRPEKWHHHNPEDPVGTAYFGCPHCGTEITKQQRVNCYFQCLKTGLTLRELLDAIASGGINWWQKRISIGVWLSPLQQISDQNIASLKIDEGLKTGDTIDWQQQSLGFPSEATDLRLSLQVVEHCIGLPVPVSVLSDTCILAGIDEGRGNHFLDITRYHLPPDWRSRSEEAINSLLDEAVREVLFSGAVTEYNLADLWLKYGVQAGLIDCDPERCNAAQWCCELPGLELAQRQDRQQNDYVKTTVQHGGVEYPVWKLRSPSFLTKVNHGFRVTAWDGMPLCRLPQEWDYWRGAMAEAENSPLRHLTAMSFDGENGKWIRPKDHLDDIYFARHFCEAAFAIFVRRVLFNLD